MTASAPFGPKSRPILTLSLLTEAGLIERAWMGDLTSFTIEPDTGATTLTSAYEGDDNEPWFLKGSAIQSTAADSLWRFTWDHSGEVASYTLAANGNTEATADEPILTGSLTVGPRPALGGDAGDKSFKFDFDWRLIAEPTFDDGAGA